MLVIKLIMIHFFPLNALSHQKRYLIQGIFKSTGCNGSMKRVPGGVICIGEFVSEGVWVIWYRDCNGSVKRVPGGVICIGGFVSEGVWVIWSRR